MKVIVISDIADLNRGVLELKEEKPTLRKLFIRLSQSGSGGTRLIQPSGELVAFLVVLLNGEIHGFLPEGLESTLKEGDRVEISVSIVGGG